MLKNKLKYLYISDPKILSLAIIVFFFGYFIFLLTRLSTLVPNFLQESKITEIYFANISDASFTVFSNKLTSCKINGLETDIHGGYQTFATDQFLSSGKVGSKIINISCGNISIWYDLGGGLNNSFQRSSGQMPSDFAFNASLSGGKIHVKICGNSSKRGIYQIPINISFFWDSFSIENKTILRYNANPGNFCITKDIAAPLFFKNSSISAGLLGGSKVYTFKNPQSYPFCFVVFAILLTIFCFYFFEKKEAFVLTVFGISIFYHFVLATTINFTFGQALAFSLLIFVFFALISAILAKLNYKKATFRALGKFLRRISPRQLLNPVAREKILFSILFTALVVFAKEFIGYSSVWGYYYSRLANEVYMHATPFIYDSLSYLGRPFVYPYLYFDFSAALSYLFNVPYLKLEPFVLSALIFVFAFLSFELYQNRLGPLLFLTETFILITMFISPLHILSFVFLELSLLFFKEKKFVFSGIALGLGFATHSLTFIFFPIMALVFIYSEILDKRLLLKYLKIFAEVFAIALIVSFPFYFRFLSEKVNELMPSRLGLLQPTYSMVTEWLLILPLFFISFADVLYKKFGTLLSRKEVNKLFYLHLFGLFLILLNKFLFRLNVAAVFVVAYIISLNLKRKEYFLAPVLNIAFVLLLYAQGWALPQSAAVTPSMISFFKYLESFPRGTAAIPGLFGHVATFYSGKPVIADYYVEYAKPENLELLESYCSNGNVSLIKKFSPQFFVAVANWCQPPADLNDFQKVYCSDKIALFIPKN